MLPSSRHGADPATAVPPSDRHTGDGRHRTLLRRFWPLGIVFLAMLGFYALGLHRYVTLDAIIRNNERLRAAVDANLGLTAAAYVGIYTLAVAVSFPGASLVTIVGGFLFGVALGTTLTVFAATLGATLIFLAARTSLGGVLRERAGRFAQRFADGFNENAFNYLLFLRLVPIFPFWLVNVAPALFDVRLRSYVLATGIGIVPGTLAYTLVGDGLGGLIEAQEVADPGCADAGTCHIELGALLTPGLLLAIAALSAAALLPVAIRRWRRRRRDPR